MPVKAIRADYHGDMKDTVDKFHGNQLINICWERHTMYGWPMCVLVSPDMPFGDLLNKILPDIYGDHPEFERIDWQAVEWSTSKGPFSPDPAKSITENGLPHKVLLRFRTLGLEGLHGVCG